MFNIQVVKQLKHLKMFAVGIYLQLLCLFSDEGTNQESTQEQIFENIRLHKEVIQSVKLQPWPIRKKLKLVRQVRRAN